MTIQLVIPQAIKQRLDYYIEAATGEISGLGEVERDGDNLIVTGVYLFEQTCSQSSTELSAEAVGNFLYQTIVLGLDPSKLKLWWHSHVNFNVFWSNIDDETAQSFNNEWMVSLVGNKKGEYLARLDVYRPFGMTLDHLPIRTPAVSNEALRAELFAEVAAKVTVEVARSVQVWDPKLGRMVTRLENSSFDDYAEWDLDYGARG